VHDYWICNLICTKSEIKATGGGTNRKKSIAIYC
jgi:hypothetical protein